MVVVLLLAFTGTGAGTHTQNTNADTWWCYSSAITATGLGTDSYSFIGLPLKLAMVSNFTFHISFSQQWQPIPAPPQSVKLVQIRISLLCPDLTFLHCVLFSCANLLWLFSTSVTALCVVQMCQPAAWAGCTWECSQLGVTWQTSRLASSSSSSSSQLWTPIHRSSDTFIAASANAPPLLCWRATLLCWRAAKQKKSVHHVLKNTIPEKMHLLLKVHSASSASAKRYIQ